MNAYKNLRMTIKPAKLHNIELKETVDMKLLEKLINSSLLQKIPWDYGHIKFENEKDQLIQFKDIIKNGEAQVTYHLPSYGVGRVFAYLGLSLGSLRRPIRHTLCFDKYIDIDMENAHPQILKQICEANNIRCKFLTEYVLNREKMLQDVMNFYNVDRDKAKKLFLVIIYLGSFDTWAKEYSIALEPTEFIEYYTAEMRIIADKIHESNPELVKIIEKAQKEEKKDKKEKKNEKSSVMSIYLQTKEREILEVIFDFMKENKIIGDNCVLCFDGLMIPKDNHNEHLLQDLNKVVLSKTGFDIKFSQKDFKEHLLDGLDDTLNKNSFFYKSLQFEKTHCKIIRRELYVESTSEGFEFFDPDKLKHNYCHMSCENEENPSKKDKFIDRWTDKNDNIRAYEDMECCPPPLKCKEGVFNTWAPFKMATLTGNYEKKEKELQFLLNHFKILCNHDEKMYDYFLKWNAQMLQFPSKKTTCIIFISKEGAGKGSYVNLMEKIMGEKKVFETTNPERDVWGNFNPIMAGGFLVVVNEINKSATSGHVGKIKGLITDSRLVVNEKGVSQYRTKSFHRFLITTNEEDPIPTKQDDRRNIFIRCSDELIGKDGYFDKFYEMIEDENVIRTFYDYLMSIPNLKNFNKKKNMPRSEYQKNLIQMNKTAVELFVEHLCEKEKGVVEFTANDLFKRFTQFVEESNITYETTVNKLAIRINMLNLGGIGAKHTTKGNVRTFDIEKLKKELKIGEDVFIDDDEQDENEDDETTEETKPESEPEPVLVVAKAKTTKPQAEPKVKKNSRLDIDFTDD